MSEVICICGLKYYTENPIFSMQHKNCEKNELKSLKHQLLKARRIIQTARCKSHLDTKDWNKLRDSWFRENL